VVDGTIESGKGAMTKIARFGIGGLGGLLPVLASLLAVDLAAIAAIVDHNETVSIGLCVGYGLRVTILFTLGGVMAVLNSEIQNPLALVQIGIAAPALITSFVSGAALNQTQRPFRQVISLVSTAFAAEVASDSGVIRSGFLNDVVGGLIPGFGTVAPTYATVSSSRVGLLCQAVTAETAGGFGLDSPQGMVVIGVVVGSPAAKAGIHRMM
jgi:hypothetical protein